MSSPPVLAAERLAASYMLAIPCKSTS